MADRALGSLATTEVELVICCAKLRAHNGERTRIIELVEGGIDWEKLFRFANPHGMLPLLYLGLNASCRSLIPADTLAEFQNIYYENTLRNITLLNEVIKLVKFLDANGVQAVPFKGPILALNLYDDLSIRRAGDVDIIVRPEDVIRVSQLLQQHGYQTEQELSPNQWQAIFDLTREYHINFLNNDKKYWLELHWNIATDEFLESREFKSFWKRLGRISVQDTEVFSFPNEDLLLLLCVHGYKHGWYRLFWIWELSELIRKIESIDWSRIQSKADQYGISKPLYTGLILARDLFGVNIPDHLTKIIALDRDVDKLTARVKRHYFQGENSITPPLITYLTFRMITNEGIINRIKWLLQFVLTPNHRDIYGLKLKFSLRYLYYFYRPFRFVFYHGKALFRR